MDFVIEAAWRTALQAKGKEWVQAELRRRPGNHDDAVYDIVFEEPYPTRQFCLNWCAEQDNKLFHFSAVNYAAIGVFILFIVFVFKAFQASNEPMEFSRPPPTAASPHVPRRATNNFSDSAQSNAPGSNAASGQQMSPVCAYITYDTDRCRVGGVAQYPLQNHHP